MRRYFPVLVLIILIVFGPLAANAQDSSSSESRDPFEDLLAMVPDDEIGHSEYSELTYTNYQAMAEAWHVADVTDDDILNETEKGRLWLSVVAAPPSLTVENSASFFSAMYDTMGFTLSDIHQALHYGPPPVDGSIVTGDIDLDAVRTALSHRGFTSYELAGFKVWCGAIGCENGITQNLQKLDSTNIFGGRFGREEPIAVMPGLLLDSASLQTLMGMVAVQVDRQPSLLELDDYQHFAEVITTQGTVLEAYTLNPELIATWEQFALPEGIRENVIASASAFGELPAYKFVGFAHVWSNNTFFTQIVLLYDDPETAGRAAQELHTRFANAAPMSSRDYRNYQELFANSAHGELLTPAIHEGQDYAAAILSLRWDLPDGQPPSTADSPYGFLTSLIWRHDLYFLGVNFSLSD
jgi:hypothetical protein